MILSLGLMAETRCPQQFMRNSNVVRFFFKLNISIVHFPKASFYFALLFCKSHTIINCNASFFSFSAALPEVILRNCRNCSPQQAQNAQKLTNFLQTRYPDVWAMLIRKYRGV